jgi:hypothetical protein
LKTIEDSEGQEGIVESIYVFENNDWERTSKINDPNSGSQIINSKSLLYGQGAFIIMNQDMTKEISFYGNAESASLNLLSGTKNIISLPQLPLYYETGHLLKDIESAGAGENSVENIWSYDGEWKKTYKMVHPLLGSQIQNSFLMSNTKFYFVVLKDTANDLLDFDPFISKNKSRLRPSKYIFFY